MAKADCVQAAISMPGDHATSGRKQACTVPRLTLKRSPTIDEANNACFIVREHRPNNPSGLLKRDSFLPSAINSFLPTARSTRGRYVGRPRGRARCVCDRQNRTTLMKFERADIKHLSGERRLVRPKPPPPVGGGFLSINSRPPCPPAASRCHGSRCCAGRRIRSKRCTMRGHVSQT